MRRTSVAWIVAAFGGLCLLVSLLPWFQTTFLVAEFGAGRSEGVAATAWGSSTLWSVAVLMAAVAGALAVGVATSTLPRWATGLVLLSSLGGFLLVVAGVLRVITVDDSAYTVGLINSDVSYSGELFAPLGTIYRDDLRLVSSEGYSQGFGYGLWLGMALIVLQLLASVTLLARSREVTASPAGCGAWTHASLLGFAVLESPPRPSYDGPQPGR